jgi:hypothetical protein
MVNHARVISSRRGRKGHLIGHTVTEPASPPVGQPDNDAWDDCSVVRHQGESAREWLVRATREQSEAFDEVTRRRERFGLDMEILPGRAESLNDGPGYDAADIRVTVAEADLTAAADAADRERERPR